MSASDDAFRVERIRRILTETHSGEPARDLCRASVAVCSVTGASVMVTSGGLPAPVCASDPVAWRIEDLQHTLGEGPCIDAHESGRPVFEPDLGAPRRERWSAFGPAAFDVGARALFAFPVRIGGVRLGALTLYQTVAGDLSDTQRADARTMADVVANAILSIQAQAPPGTLAAELETLAGHRSEIHQATGMVSVQLGVGVDEALVRLRAHAHTAGRPLAEVAADVVNRRLRFDQ